MIVFRMIPFHSLHFNLMFFLCLCCSVMICGESFWFDTDDFIRICI